MTVAYPMHVNAYLPSRTGSGGDHQRAVRGAWWSEKVRTDSSEKKLEQNTCTYVQTMTAVGGLDMTHGLDVRRYRGRVLASSRMRQRSDIDVRMPRTAVINVMDITLTYCV